MTITLHMPPRLETRLLDEAAREGIDADTLVLRTLERQFGAVSVPPVPSPHSDRESELLLRIGEGPSEIIWRRYRELSEKRDAEALTPEEHEELVTLSETIEAADVDRLEYASELAKLRGVNLRALLGSLGIPNSSLADRPGHV